MTISSQLTCRFLLFLLDTGVVFLHDGANEAFRVPGRRFCKVLAQGVFPAHGPDQTTQGQSWFPRGRLAVFSGDVLASSPLRKDSSS